MLAEAPNLLLKTCSTEVPSPSPAAQVKLPIRSFSQYGAWYRGLARQPPKLSWQGRMHASMLGRCGSYRELGRQMVSLQQTLLTRTHMS